MQFGPTNLTEYLFANKNGEINAQIDTKVINAIYASYMQSLVDSYERLKIKFNQLQTRCLTEKQRKEQGLNLVAPTLVMPVDKDRQDDEAEANSSEMLGSRPRVDHDNDLGRMRKEDADEPEDEEIKESEARENQYNLEDSDHEGLNKNMKGQL